MTPLSVRGGDRCRGIAARDGLIRKVIPEGTGSVKGWFGFLRWLPGRDGTARGSSWSAHSRLWRRGRTSLTSPGGTARGLSTKRPGWVLCGQGPRRVSSSDLVARGWACPGLGCQSSLRHARRGGWHGADARCRPRRAQSEGRPRRTRFGGHDQHEHAPTVDGPSHPHAGAVHAATSVVVSRQRMWRSRSP